MDMKDGYTTCTLISVLKIKKELALIFFDIFF